MFAAGIYHTFEQHLLQFHRKELLSLFEERDLSLYKVSLLRKRLRRHGIDVETFSSWNKIEELRLVANTVKHAEGDSAERLRTVRPDLFDPPNMEELGIKPFGANRSIFLPLVGEDLFVREGDIRQYRDAIILFWEELAGALERG